jgi:Fe-Mn family superoxide dismutase
VTEDDTVDGDATDDESETDLEAAANDTIDADGDTEDEPEDVVWIKKQPLPYPLVSTQSVNLLRLVAKWNDRKIW